MDRREIASFNAVRGIAALAVCANHLRAFLFVQFPAVVGANYADRFFYLVTGLGHQAVVVFFVMSGWLIGSSVSNQNRFSWTLYAIARMSRLLVVLVPALLFTAAIDALGIWLSGGTGYDGSQHAVLLSAPAPDAQISLSPLTAFGNLLFLQTILVPVYGTNGPLWSLANEFWYYAIFPMFAVAWRLRSRHSVAFAAAGLAILMVLPAPMSAAFAIWLFGWIGSILYPRIRAPKTLCAVSAVLMAAVLMVSKVYPFPIFDYILGIAVTGLLASLMALPERRPRFLWARVLFSNLARISFTLYLFHFPLLVFFFFSLHQRQRQPVMVVYGEFTALLCMVLLISACFWYLFERRTDSVRRFVTSSIVIRAKTL